MRMVPLLLLFALSVNPIVGNAVNSAVNFSDALNGVAPVAEGDAPNLVPKITFADEVNGESVAAAIDLINQANEAGAKAIIFEIDTPGGEIGTGFRLARAIEESKAPVVCVVDDSALSMGMYLLQSCKVRIMTKRSSLMIHEAGMGGMVMGHEVTWRNIAEALKAINKAMFEHVARRMTVKPEWIADKCRGGSQWWLNWDEALKVHAVDYVVTSVGEVVDSYRTTLKQPAQAISQ